jgi:hypothetical protein
MLLVRSHLRHAICLLLLECGRPMKVADIATELTSRGYRLRGRPTQAVSDVLRTEVRCGRAVKVDHGTYMAGKVTPGHIRYAERRLHELRTGRVSILRIR